MKNIGVRDLPGVGRVIEEKLKQNYSVETCEHLQKVPLLTLKQDFGLKTGQLLHDLAHGKDDKSILEFDEERKSVSAEINYGIRFSDILETETFILQLSEEVSRRLLEIMPGSNLTAKQLTLKIMVRSADAPVETRKFLGHGICDSFSKSANLSSATSDPNVIKRESMFLLKMLLKTNAREVNDLRGIGIQLNKFEKGSKQMPNILNFMNRNVDKSLLRTNPNESFKNTTEDTKTDAMNLNNLSISQIDQDTLDALPQDIKNEILQGIASNRTNHIPESSKNKQIELDKVGIKTNNINNISFSQFDPNVLSELPIELQQELRAQFPSKTRRNMTGFEKIMGKSSSDQQRDQTGSRNKRGRPPKNDPKFCKNLKVKSKISNRTSPIKTKNHSLADKAAQMADEITGAFVPKHDANTLNPMVYEDALLEINLKKHGENSEVLDYKLGSLTDSIVPNKDGKPSNENIRNEDPNTIAQTNDIHTTSYTKNSMSDEADTENPEGSRDASVENETETLDSKHSIEELRPLFRKWIKSFVTPTYDDVDTISKYFKSQVKDNKIELVHMGLKSLCKMCLSSEHPENWTGAYNGIVREVQQAMLKFYGKRLSVNFRF